MDDHKKIPKTNFIVDYFTGIPLPDHIYFLSHYHSDHYGGIRKSFDRPIYCSETTSTLLQLYSRIDSKHIHTLEHNRIYNVGEHMVMAIDANHCPGASMFIFYIHKEIILHTGDFRADNYFLNTYFFKQYDFNYSVCYLDNTYEGKKNFQSQKIIIFNLLNYIRKEEFRNDRLARTAKKYFFTSYLIGKEKIFFAIAHFFNWKIEVDEKKYKTLNSFSKYDKIYLNHYIKEILREYEVEYGEYRRRKFLVNLDFNDEYYTDCIFNRITVNNRDTKLSVINNYISKRENFLKNLKNYRRAENYLIVPSGWRDKIVNWRIKGEKIINIFIPYSEHSSWNELENFKSQLKCKKYINTVNFN